MNMSARFLRLLNPGVERRRMELRRLMQEATAHSEDIIVSVRAMRVNGESAFPKKNGVKKPI